MGRAQAGISSDNQAGYGAMREFFRRNCAGMCFGKSAGTCVGKLAGKAAGQASVELLVVLGISLAVVLLFTVLAMDAMSDISFQQDINDAYSSAKGLADAADMVYSQGEGASLTVPINLPPSTDLNRESSFIGRPPSAADGIEPKLIRIKVGDNDVGAMSAAPLSGSFPSMAGIGIMKVVSHGNYVSINPSLVDIDRNAIFVSMASGETRQANLTIYKVSAESVSVLITKNWAFSAPTLAISSVSFSPLAAGTAVSFTFSAVPSAPAGVYNSNIVLTATGAQSGANETFSVPISASVQSG